MFKRVSVDAFDGIQSAWPINSKVTVFSIFILKNKKKTRKIYDKRKAVIGKTI
jgi:hypothetical protein